MAVTEVDTETGKAVLRRVVTVDDAGTVINPLLTEGQRHGGIAQGAAQALLEEVVYDAEGNPLTATFADYPFITATRVPQLRAGQIDGSVPPTAGHPLQRRSGLEVSVGATQRGAPGTWRPVGSTRRS